MTPRVHNLDTINPHPSPGLASLYRRALSLRATCQLDLSPLFRNGMLSQTVT